MGADIVESEKEIVCTAPKLHGAHIRFPIPSVGATENVLLAACAAEGETVIENAAREPEIEDLQEYLRRLGAEIGGAGTDTITVSGFSPGKAVGHRIMGAAVNIVLRDRARRRREEALRAEDETADD